MSEGYRTEEEQVEALKNWWNESGKSTVMWIVVAIVGVLGWQGWQKQQQSSREAASAVYQNFLTAVDQGEAGMVTASHLAQTLRDDFSSSTYAQYAALYQARFAVEKNDLATAEQHLNWVLAENPEDEIRLQANLRLARLKYAAGQYDEAMQLLNTDAQGFAASYSEVKGDILKAKGNLQQALDAYLNAQNLSLARQYPTENSVLQIKIQQLQSQLATNAGSEVENG